MSDAISVAASDAHDRALLIVDDDENFRCRLGSAMTDRGFAVTAVESAEAGRRVIEAAPPAFAIIDLRLGDGTGLDLMSALKERRPDARAIMLTGYGNLKTAVIAVKLGAFDYLAKPADADDIFNALVCNQDERAPLPAHPMSADDVRYGHIADTYERSGRNVSETARQLSMHRRTLQRILARHA